MSLTVYHEGSFDGVQLDFVDIVTDFVTLRCPQGKDNLLRKNYLQHFSLLHPYTMLKDVTNYQNL